MLNSMGWLAGAGEPTTALTSAAAGAMRANQDAPMRASVAVLRYFDSALIENADTRVSPFRSNDMIKLNDGRQMRGHGAILEVSLPQKLSKFARFPQIRAFFLLTNLDF